MAVPEPSESATVEASVRQKSSRLSELIHTNLGILDEVDQCIEFCEVENVQMGIAWGKVA